SPLHADQPPNEDSKQGFATLPTLPFADPFLYSFHSRTSAAHRTVPCAAESPVRQNRPLCGYPLKRQLFKKVCNRCHTNVK
ncbi:MAG: hypothetical protein IKD06_04715, partial [Clostridia bacterium]|nr:hypothetical protein [Clostridia bacterium]